ncbi:uncharacterized protein TrAtP1_001658 [Trichoderma atroviride]|uniref:uncharacterized protein n=1 Tax=Hypocrea atroviridis TaxID=63577 RepID=UPI003323B88C|nr:hypothetical protein TrAtP1_001658 [Trichoderma atroviride]
MPSLCIRLENLANREPSKRLRCCTRPCQDNNHAFEAKGPLCNAKHAPSEDYAAASDPVRLTAMSSEDMNGMTVRQNWKRGCPLPPALPG